MNTSSERPAITPSEECPRGRARFIDRRIVLLRGWHLEESVDACLERRMNTNTPQPLLPPIEIRAFTFALFAGWDMTVKSAYFVTSIPAQGGNATIPARESLRAAALASHTEALGVTIVRAPPEVALRSSEACVTAHNVATVRSPVTSDTYAFAIEAQTIA